MTYMSDYSDDSDDCFHLNVPVREDLPAQLAVKAREVVEEMEMQDEAVDFHADDGVSTSDEIDVQIRNVVCNFTIPLHIDLHRVAANCANVTFDRGHGVLLKQKRNPNCYVKIYSSGKVYIVGCRSENECKSAARGVARMVQRHMNRIGDVVRIRNYRVCNVLATCKMPFGIKIGELASKYPSITQFEPELSVGLIWRSSSPKATLRIHTTGSITVTGAGSEEDVRKAYEMIYPIVFEFRCNYRLRDGSNMIRGGRPPSPSSQRQRKRPVPSTNRVISKRPLLSEGSFPSCSGLLGNRVYFGDEDDDCIDENY